MDTPQAKAISWGTWKKIILFGLLLSVAGGWLLSRWPAATQAATRLKAALGVETGAPAAQPNNPATQAATTAFAVPAQDTLSREAATQIEAVLRDKAQRTPAQRKLDSNLIYAARQARGEDAVPGIRQLEVNVRMIRNARTGADDLTEVDIIAHAGGVLQDRIRAIGELVSAFPQYRAYRARVPLDQLEALAALPEVIFIGPPQEAMTQRKLEAAPATAVPAQATAASAAREPFAVRAARVKEQLRQQLPQLARAKANRLPAGLATSAALNPFSPLTSAAMWLGSTTSQGDATHKAALARGVFGIDGTGIKIGVLSDGVANLAASQALGDLGPVTVLPGQAGSGDEGTAMLEIVRDLAPGAQLYFATAFGGIATFANNIRGLRTAGCDVIVDDVFYYVETPFQDGQAPAIVSNTNGGVVIQAVNDVTAAGAMYFSSAGNSGNKNDGTSGVWEGDFVDGGNASGVLTGAGRIHNFGGQLFNTLTAANTSAPISLYWSDPLGGSANDYDIFRLNAAGTGIAAAGTNAQDGTQDPYEQISQSTTNPRIVIALFSGVARHLHLNTNRGRLSISTNGQTHGHSHAANGFSVAASPSGPTRFNSTDAPGPFPNAFNAANVLETFSSDGPRRIFYNADGTAITPGNFLATGGLVRQKPDITAADGVAVTGVGGFGSPFFGTSAAAPHAAAIAGLIKSAGPYTNAQIRTALINTAIDIEAPGVDRDAGAGIVMALEALKSLGAPGFAYLALGTVTIGEVAGNGNGVIEPGETGAVTIPLTNIGVAAATNVQATLASTTPGITITQAGPQSYGTIAPDGTALNPNSYIFTVSSNYPCNQVANFALTATYGGGPAPSQVLGFQQAFGVPLTITQTLDATPAVAGMGYTAATGTQNNRLNRNGVIPTCGAPKTTPNLQEVGVGTAKRYDAFTFTNPAATTVCFTAKLSSACNAASGSQLYLVAYNKNGFVPTAIQSNYLADWGVTTLGDQTISFNVPAGEQFTVVLHEVTAGATNTNACPYTLTISGLPCPAPPVCAPITVSPNSLSNGTVGTAYNATISALPVLSYSFAVTDGIVPPGLSLNPATGLLSGTPTASGTYNFRVTASAGFCSGFRDYALTIGCPTLTIGPSSLPNAAAGVAYNQTLTVTPAGTYSFSLLAGNLPPGINFNTATGQLSGTATATGSYTFTVQATAANGCSATKAYTLTVACPTVTVNPASLPGGSVGTVYSQTLSATPAGNYGFAVTAGALPGGLSLSSAGVLSGTPTVQGTFNFTVTASGFGACTGTRAYSVTVSASCTTITLPALPATGTVGVNYYGNLAATTPSGTYTFSLDSGTLPPGLTIDNLFGALSGKPTAANTYTFTLKATRSNGCTGTRAYTVVISSAMMSAQARTADYDGDGKTDLSLWSAGRWQILRSSDEQLQTPQWGGVGDLALLGDYDGDSVTDLAVYRPRNGTWYVQRSSDGAALVKAWGGATDVPVPGDYDGDGQTDLAVFRPSEGNWYVLKSSDGGYLVKTWGLGSAPYLDVPVPGDYDGDGITDLAVFRRQTGTWLVQRSSDGQYVSKAWGGATDVPVVGDYDGDGQADLAVWRGATGEWFVLRSADQGYNITKWGAASVGDVPAPGDYDGDGRFDLAVWRSTEGAWYVLQSSDGALRTRDLGQRGDLPIAARQ